ncbi:STAS domain-containing protein [Sphingomonas sp. XXL09]|uniref:STAS domain-containing protein n=1 Tax=Sphingomonas sp. XXL09 TaxID=3457787 RepID=UPI00406BB710
MSITIVTANEDLCLPSIGTCAADLRQAFDEGGAVRLDLSSVRTPDLSVVQLACAARASAAKIGLDFGLSTPADAALRALLIRAGLMTDASADDLQFWFHGEATQ